MFAQKFENLIHKYPQEADALSRIAEYFANTEKNIGGRVMKVQLGPQRLFDISGAGSTSRLARVIALLVDEHVLQRLLIVESPSGAGGIGTFHTYSEVPQVIHDRFQDVELLVTPEILRTVYMPAV